MAFEMATDCEVVDEQLGIDDETLAEIIENAAQTAIRAKVEKTYTKEAIEAIFALAK